MLRPASNPVELSLWDCTCRWRRRHKGSHEYHFWVIWPTQSLNDSERRTRMFFSCKSGKLLHAALKKTWISHRREFGEPRGTFCRSQRVYKVAGHLLQSPLLGCVSWSLDIGQLRITIPQTLYKAALAGVLQQHYRSIDRISPDLPLAARRSNPFL